MTANLSLWRACPAPAAGETKREDEKSQLNKCPLISNSNNIIDFQKDKLFCREIPGDWWDSFYYQLVLI